MLTWCVCVQLLAFASVVHCITSIPFDSTLVLGNVIEKEKIDSLQAIAELQKGVDIAQDRYNAFVRTRLSLQMSIEELGTMNIDIPTEVTKERNAIDEKIKQALIDRVDKRIQYQDKYSEMLGKQKQKKIGEEPESPLDFATSKLQDMAISSDTMNLDVQYFRFEKKTQGSQSHASKVSAWAASSVSSVFGFGAGAKAQSDTERHVNSQTEQNELIGTIVIFVAATHKKAKMFSPTVYDPLKLIRAWKANNGESINLPRDAEKLYMEWCGKDVPAGAPSLNLLTGVTYGSSFIGFIHFVKSSSTQSHQEMESNAASAQAQATYENFFATITGGFGMDSRTASDLKQLTSSNKILSHVGLITMGIIPSLASQKVSTALKEFSNFDPGEIDGKLTAMANGDSGQVPNMDGGARTNIRAGQINGMQAAKMQAVLSGVQAADQADNQVIDMNSLMLALDDYIKNARDADGGVPVNFFVSSVTKNDILREWFSKYRTDLYNRCMLAQDSTGGNGGGGGGGSPTPAPSPAPQ
jgi:hypothetical protein